MKDTRLKLACICLMTLAASFCSGQANTSPGVENSAAGLQDQLVQVLKASQERNSTHFESLVNDLRIPDDGNWFAATFGEDTGARLLDAYKDSWTSYEDHLTHAFRDLKAEKNPHVEIEVLSADEKNLMVRSVVEDAKSPLQLYSAKIQTKNRGKAALPGIFVYVQGSFRVLNLYTLYALGNVKPMRIRIGGNVADAQLVHKVTPEYPTVAAAQHIQGTVVFHAVIGLKGNIELLQFVSGPQELMPSAMDAVKQWRYKPTFLNGDPVEVDTMISVLYTLGR